MPELTEDQQSGMPDLQRLTEIARRRHLHFLIPFFLGWVLVWGSSWVLPALYKSSTLILVQQPTMPQNYVLPNINDDIQARLQSMREQVLSRTRLLVIINKLHLYGDDQSGAADDGKVALMRRDIDIDLAQQPGRSDINSFTISYSAKDPHLAQQVDTELTNLFISNTNRVTQEESEGTTDFLAKQLEDARQNLAEQEAKVKQFESEHEGALPTQSQSNLQILSGLQAELQNDEEALNTAKQQRVYLQALLQQERAAQASVRVITDQSGASVPTDLASIDQQLDSLRAQLADLNSKYTDRYPDVVRVKKQIAKTELARQNLVAAMKAEESGAKHPDDTATAQTVTNPAIRQLQGQMQANQVEISNRETSIEGLKARIGEYQGRLNLEPATEQQLDDLTRGYEQSQAIYNELLKKESDSRMATSMEQTQQDERFIMLDPPSLPGGPYFPNRLKFCAMGFGAGLGLGFLVAVGLEFLDDRLHGEKQIKALLPITVLSEIPEIVTPSDEKKTKRRFVLAWSMTAVVALIVAAGTVFSIFFS